VSGKYATYAFNWAGGVLVKWFRDTFASHLKDEAKARGISVYKLLDEMCPSNSSDVIVIPHHMGAGGTPDTVATAKGTITGLTMKTTVYDIYRAVLEGLTFEMLYNIETLSRFGIKIDSLRATGGGSSSQVWLKIKADILGRAICPVDVDEAGAAGCAMMAAVAMGAFDNLHQAAEVFVKTSKVVTPSTENAQFYAEKYERYKKIRESMLGMWES
jgi:xylulokinase